MIQGHRIAFLLVVSLCAILVSVACAVNHRPPPPPPPLAPTADQVSRGEVLYQALCEQCHDLENGIGPRLTHDVIATHLSAAALFKYTRKSMPYKAPGSLSDQEYWDVTAYMLFRTGFLERDVVLDSESEEALVLSK